MTLIKMITVSNINFEQNVNRHLIMLQDQGCEILNIHFDLDKANSIVIINYKKKDEEV
jgi:hypothetical protein